MNSAGAVAEVARRPLRTLRRRACTSVAEMNMVNDDLERFLRRVAAELEKQAKCVGGGYGELGRAVELRLRGKWLTQLLDGYAERHRTGTAV